MTIQTSDLEAYCAGTKELVEVLGVEPGYVEKLKGRTQLFLDTGNFERALIMLEMLEALDRRDPLPALLAVDVLLRLGWSDRAETKINARLQANPQDLSFLVAKAELLIAIGELHTAARTLQRVVDADPEQQTAPGKRARAVAAHAHALFGG